MRALPALLAACALAACEPAPPAEVPNEAEPAAPKGPDRVTVRHILISFRGKIRKPEVTRSQDQAERLAADLYRRALNGENFIELTKRYSDDSPEGVYKLANFRIKPLEKEYPRARMVKSFGDLAFSLEVGEIKVVKYDPKTSPFGWHIVKRIQ